MFDLLNLIHILRWNKISGNDTAWKMNKYEDDLMINRRFFEKISLEPKGHKVQK